jgi:hypothetical protein
MLGQLPQDAHRLRRERHPIFDGGPKIFKGRVVPALLDLNRGETNSRGRVLRRETLSFTEIQLGEYRIRSPQRQLTGEGIDVGVCRELFKGRIDQFCGGLRGILSDLGDRPDSPFRYRLNRDG